MVAELTAIDGSMFAGKTTEEKRLYRRAEIAGKSIQVFKPSNDTRYNAQQVCSHDGDELPAISIDKEHPEDILTNLLPKTDYVIIDEAQFFDERLVLVVESMLVADIEVVVAGLSLDFRGEEFQPMAKLVHLAEHRTHLTAICKYVDEDGRVCGKEAIRTQRLVDLEPAPNGTPAPYDSPVVQVGASEAYTARCREHHFVPGKPTLVAAK